MSVGVESIFAAGYRAFLFDMDGTILNSIAVAERIWGAWALEHGLNVATFLPTIHGSRSIDTITRLGLSGVDPHVEAERITEAEIATLDGVVEIAGAAAFLGSLPPERWAVVTSASRALAKARLMAAGLPLPRVLLTSEDVTNGKPNPECYERAAQKLGVRATECLIFEDAPVGIAAAKATGAQVVIVGEQQAHSIEPGHLTIQNYEGLSARTNGAGFLSVARR